MIWSYRALNNPASRRKWILIILAIIAVGIGYAFYKISIGYPTGKALLETSIFILFVVLYAIITLGKPRVYYIEGGFVYYKPLKTDLRKIKGFEVDEKNLLIKLKGAGLFNVRTLYFENLEDLRKAVRFLERQRY